MEKLGMVKAKKKPAQAVPVNLPKYSTAEVQDMLKPKDDEVDPTTKVDRIGGLGFEKYVSLIEPT